MDQNAFNAGCLWTEDLYLPYAIVANAKANTPLVIGSWTREQSPIFHNSSSNLKLLKLENHSFTISLLNQFIVVSTYKNRSLYKEWLLNIKKKNISSADKII